jgi:hypothetical protein
LPKELRRLSAKLMANRSDRHLSNLSNCQGAKPVRLIRGRCADFPSWPGVQHGAPSRGRIHDRNRISAIRAATLRTGLGPYMTVQVKPCKIGRPSAYFDHLSLNCKRRRTRWQRELNSSFRYRPPRIAAPGCFVAQAAEVSTPRPRASSLGRPAVRGGGVEVWLDGCGNRRLVAR